jgi:chromate transporter
MTTELSGAPAHPSFTELTAASLKIGLLGFGGPAGQISLMHRIFVEEKRWIGEQRFLMALNYCMLLPGPEAQQLATYVGWLLHGWRGGVVAGTLFVVPGLVVLLVLSAAYALYQETGWLEGIFFGLKAAVLAIVIDAVIRVGRRALRNGIMVCIAVAAFLALFLFGAPFPVVIVLAGILGLAGTMMRPELFVPPPKPTPIAGGFLELDVRTRGGIGHAVQTIALWGALWLAPLLLIVPVFGWGSVFTPIFVFFSQMAVVTFGGAYAVLAYVAQQAVEGFGWLQPGEMLDGLALAETTPGPLVLVLTFVGFLAAFREATGLDPLLAGLLGGLLVTWVTFVPCFLWIFLGAPYVERLNANRALSGALSAITAAVVGVIANLALWFGLHVLFREMSEARVGPVSVDLPNPASLDPLALALSVIAAIMLFRLRIGIVPVLAASAGLGLISQWLI